MSQHDTQNYNSLSRFVHWIMAALILGLVLVGFFMAQMDSAPLKFEIYGWHKSLGITVLLLALIRVAWKFYKKPPASLSAHKNWEKLLSKTIHIVLYVSLFVMPLSGWVMSSSGGHAVHFFGLFELPQIAAKDKVISGLARSVHYYAALGVVGSVALHVVGALKHHFMDKDVTLTRMGGRPVFGVIAIVVLLVSIGVLVRGELAERQAKSAAVSVAAEVVEAP